MANTPISRIVLRFNIALPKVDAVYALIDGGLACETAKDDLAAD